MQLYFSGFLYSVSEYKADRGVSKDTDSQTELRLASKALQTLLYCILNFSTAFGNGNETRVKKDTISSNGS
jgi:hypothetical protein